MALVPESAACNEDSFFCVCLGLGFTYFEWLTMQTCVLMDSFVHGKPA